MVCNQERAIMSRVQYKDKYHKIHQTLCFNDSGKSLAFCTHCCAIRLSFVLVGSIEFKEEKGPLLKSLFNFLALHSRELLSI